MQRRLLQIAYGFSGLAPVVFGRLGVFLGADADLGGNLAMDSYVRILKGMPQAIGLICWSSIPDIAAEVAQRDAMTG